MKILYISNGIQVDYQNDCLFIGLKELFGENVVDIPKRSHSYITHDQIKASRMYGMGMTVTRILDDLDVDRTDINSKIKNKYFDIIVYGSIWRNRDYLDEVLEYYPKEKIGLVDGEDHLGIYPLYKDGVKYFKRELIDDRGGIVNPISFAIPECKLNFNVSKTRDIAICDPHDKTTYIYKNEKDYYNGYGESRFAYTKKKAGWDCLRHYEIMANGCIPIFKDIDKCPKLTIVNFPKDTCLEILDRIEKEENMEEIYERYHSVFENMARSSTTKSLAEYFIKVMLQ